jgi:hypothetical protein
MLRDGEQVEDLGRWLHGLNAFTRLHLSGEALGCERIDQIGLLESIKAAAAGAQARVSVASADSQRESQAVSGLPARERGKGVAAQIALARKDSPARGSRHLGFGEAMVHELPHTVAHLEAGSVSEWRATIVCRETACLSPEDRAEVDAALAADLPRLGDRQVEARAKALACQLHAAAMAERAARAHSERRVSLRPAPDTMTHLTALLPVAQGVAVLAAAAAVPIEIQLVMPAEASDEPALLGGHVLPAQTARDLVSSARQESARLTMRKVLTSADGVDLERLSPRREPLTTADHLEHRVSPATTVADVAASARRFTGTLRRFIRLRDQTCRTPWCDAPIRRLDHAMAARDDGATTTANGQGLCEACNYAKEAPGWRARTVRAGPRHTVRTTTPTGHSYDSTAPPLLPARVRAGPRVSALERHYDAMLLSA